MFHLSGKCDRFFPAWTDQCAHSSSSASRLSQMEPFYAGGAGRFSCIPFVPNGSGRDQYTLWDDRNLGFVSKASDRKRPVRI